MGLTRRTPEVQTRNHRDGIEPGAPCFIAPLSCAEIQDADDSFQRDVYGSRCHASAFSGRSAQATREPILHIWRERLVVDVVDWSITNVGIELLQIQRRESYGWLVLVLHQIARSRLAPRSYPSNAVDVLLPQLLQAMDQVLLRLLPVT